MEATAKFSPCRVYRYTLWRIWGDGKRFVQFIGLNPSTADELKNDPTVRRCIIFAKDWGYDGMCMTNLFAYRSPSPQVMKKQAEPIGEENDKYLMEIAASAELIVAAWGNHGKHRKRDDAIKEMFKSRLTCLATSDGGNPKHPLYLSGALKPFPFY